MSLLATKDPLYATFKSLVALYLSMLFGLYLDSFYMLKITENGQYYANIISFIVLAITFWQVNKRLGLFSQGKYHKYWNRSWHDFSVGFNYRII